MTSGLMHSVPLRVTDLVQPDLTRKTEKAAQDFEAILLGQWLEKVQESVADLGAEENDPGKATSNSVALQALATGISAQGGLGIGRLLLKHLQHQSSAPTPNDVSTDSPGPDPASGPKH